MSNISDCPVCFESMTKSAMSLSNCAHHVCEDCSHTLEKEKKIECPICRKISERANRDHEYQNLLEIIEKMTPIKPSTLKWKNKEIKVFLNGNRAKEIKDLNKTYEHCICCGKHETSHEQWEGQYCCKETKCVNTFTEIYAALPASFFIHEKDNPTDDFVEVEFPETLNIETTEPPAPPEVPAPEIQAVPQQSHGHPSIFNWFWRLFGQKKPN